MVKQTIVNQVLFDYVLADNWFGAKTNMEFMHYEINKFFIFGIKANRLIAFLEEERKSSQYHKSIKQNTSLEKSPTKVVRSQKNHISASIISYCKLKFLKIRTALNHFALKYKLILKANQTAF